MQQFELPNFTRVLVTNVNVRSELHGEEHVPAADVFFRLTTANTILDVLVPPLRQMLYRALEENEEPEQLELDEVDPATDTPLLRCQDLRMPLRLTKECIGWRVEFDYGRGGRSNLVLAGVKLDKFEVDAKEGGTVDVWWKCSASRLDRDAIGKLGVMIGLEQVARITAPTVGEAIDGTVGHPAAEAQPDATDAFLAAQGATA